MTQACYAVTGATGFIGRRLLEHLVEQGHRVIAVTRSANAIPGTEVRVADVTDPDALDKAFAGVDGVFHLAALFNDADKTWDDYRLVNVTGTENVIRAAHHQGVARVVHCSTVGVATEACAPPYDEDTPYSPQPDDKYEVSKCEGEQAARQLAKEMGQSLVVVRPTQVYGPNDRSKIKFYKLVRKGWVVNPSGTVKHPVYVDDLCRGMELAMQRPEADHEVILIGGERSVPLKEMIRYASESLGVPNPKSLPAWPVQLACVCIEKLFAAINKKPPLHSRSMDFFRRSVAVESRKAYELLGYEPQVSLEDGVRRTVDWYKRNGLL